MLILRIIIIPLTVLLITPMLYCLVKKLNLKKESNMSKDEFVIMNSPVFCYIILFCEIVFSVILIMLNLLKKINIIQDIICISILIIFAVLFIGMIREKVFVKGMEIKVVPAFGKTQELSFSDIDYIKVITTSRSLISYKVCNSKCRSFSFSNFHIGAQLFIDTAKENNISIEMQV